MSSHDSAEVGHDHHTESSAGTPAAGRPPQLTPAIEQLATVLAGAQLVCLSAAEREAIEDLILALNNLLGT